jgi:hypothetical protein
MEGNMSVDEQRLRQSLHARLAALLGADETALLMNYLPPVGWADVATKRDLDVLRSELRGELKAQTTRMLLWLVPTIIAGMGVAARLG